MASVKIKTNDPVKLKNTLINKFSIEVPIFKWRGKSIMRYSFQVYNDQKDADFLVNTLKDLLI